MKANELRIGNWIYEHFIKYDENGVPYIKGRETKVEWIDVMRQIKIPAIFTAIPITQEWCDRIEMNEAYRLVHSSGNKLILETKTTTTFSSGRKKESTWNSIGIVEFIHELQNLYRWSYGEELTINE